MQALGACDPGSNPGLPNFIKDFTIKFMSKILANLGFILQFSGILILISAFVALYYNEMKEAIAFFITSSVFFLIGFPLNALSERKDLNFTQSLFLLLLTFVILGLIGSIPYIYLDIFSEKILQEKIVNSIFESVSGFTTTGFSFLDFKGYQLSNSLIFFRSLSQFIGGVGIVYLLLTFLYSHEHKITRFLNKILGFENNTNIKRNFLEVIAFYSISLIVLTSTLYYFSQDFIKSFSLVASGVSTGGFTHYDLSSLSFEEKLIVMISMILGSISIFILSKFKKEIGIYIVSILLSSFVLYNFGYDIITSVFHSISFTSTTGYFYINLDSFSPTILFYLSLIMLMGGMAISTSGGFKIIRLVNSLKFIKNSIVSFVLNKSIKMNEDYIFSILIVFLYLIFWIFLAFIFSFYGYDFSKSLFDIASALSTSGFSTGIVNIEMPVELKILIIFYMILGRIEIVAIFSIFFINKSVLDEEEITKIKVEK